MQAQAVVKYHISSVRPGKVETWIMMTVCGTQGLLQAAGGSMN